MRSRDALVDSRFYVVGGTVERGARCYVERRADTELYEGLSQGHFCYVLTSRQMGKSSLMVRTASRLRDEGVAVAVLDVTGIGQNVTAEQWYDGLLMQLAQQLEVEDAVEAFWGSHARLGPFQRWIHAIREVVLRRHSGRIVIFTDEIDAVRSLPFSTDEFFAGIRECYNRRTEDPELRRLTFCLLGVATPSDLIRDTRTTPFNIGKRIELTDFEQGEAEPLVEGLRRDPAQGAALLGRVLHWTGGHPYLTQRLCQAVSEDESVAGSDGVDRTCEELFLSSRAQERDDNLLFVRTRLLRSEVDVAGLLTLYRRVRTRKAVPDEVTDPLVAVLRLAGVTRVERGLLAVRNRIYERVFDPAWIASSMPDAEVQRQRAAFRRGVVRSAAVAVVILVAMWALLAYALRSRQQALAQRQIAEEQRHRADQSLVEANASASRARGALAAEAEQRRVAEDRREEADRARNAADAQRLRAVQQERSNRRLLYAAQMNLASQDWENNNVGRMTALLESHIPQPGQDDLRGFEWYYLWKQSHQSVLDLRHDSAVVAVAFMPDGRRLVTGARDGVVRIWEIGTGRVLTTIKKLDSTLYTMSLSGDGRTVAVGGPQPTGYRGIVKVWDLATGREVLALTRERAPAYSIALSQDATRLVVGGWSSNVVEVFDVPSGRRLWQTSDGKVQPRSVALSPDGKTFTVQTGGLLELRDAETSKLRVTLGQSAGHNGVSAFSPDGKSLWQTVGDRIVVRDPSTGKERASYALGSTGVGGDGNTFDGCLSFSPDGTRVLLLLADRSAQVWDVQTGRQLQTVRAAGALTAGAFSPDGTQFATASADGAVSLWDTRVEEDVPAVTPPPGATVSRSDLLRDGRRAVYSGRQPAPNTSSWWVIVKELETGRTIWSTDDIGTTNQPPPLSPDGSLLGAFVAGPSSSTDETGITGRIRVWDTSTGDKLLETRALGVNVYRLRFSSNSRRFATSNWDRSVTVWDCVTGRELATLKGVEATGFRELALSPNGARLVTALRSAAAAGQLGVADAVDLWDVATGKHITGLETRSVASIAELTFSSGGRLVAGYTSTGGIVVWEAASGRQVANVVAHVSRIAALVFSPDGKRLVSGDQEGTLKVWDPTSGDELLTLRYPDPSDMPRQTGWLRGLSFSAAGDELVASAADGSFRRWRIATPKEVEAARERR